VLDLELYDLKVLEMLATKAMDTLRKEHTTPFHKWHLIYDPTLGVKLL
jgi:hypothetical protein